MPLNVPLSPTYTDEFAFKSMSLSIPFTVISISPALCTKPFSITFPLANNLLSEICPIASAVMVLPPNLMDLVVPDLNTLNILLAIINLPSDVLIWISYLPGSIVPFNVAVNVVLLSTLISVSGILPTEIFIPSSKPPPVIVTLMPFVTSFIQVVPGVIDDIPNVFSSIFSIESLLPSSDGLFSSLI